MNSDSEPKLVGTWQPMRGPFARWPRAADAVLAFAVFMWTLLVTDNNPDQDLALRAVSEVPIPAILAFALCSGALYWRRSKPLLVLALNLALMAFLTAFSFSNSVWALPVALYSVGRYATHDRWSYAGAFAALVWAAINTVADGEPASSIGPALVIVFLIWYIGRYIRVRGEYLNLLQERASQLERQQAAEASRAVAEERTRIARELHDVVAHRVSMMTVQAGAAKTVADDDPEGALRAMGAVENAGRQALDELRHLMGVLRPEVDADTLGPQPGIADIPRIVDQLKDAGLNVSLTMNDMPSDLAARVELSAFRIVQEALTNVLKHAGPGTQTEVHVNANDHEIIVEVLDSGGGRTGLPGAGHGIVGMQERAHLLGGSLQAGPRPTGGYQVMARLPFAEALI